MTKIESTPIAPEEAQEMMRDDIVALLSKDMACPLARSIEEALRRLSVPLAPPQPK